MSQNNHLTEVWMPVSFTEHRRGSSEEVKFQFSSVQSLSRVQLFAIPWIAALQASLSITNSRSSLRLTSIESVMPSSCLIPCRPLLLLPPIPPSIRVFSNESTLCMRWPKYWKALILQISPGLARLGEGMYSFLSSSHLQVNRIRMFAWTKTLQFSIQAERKVSPGRTLCVDSILLLNKSNGKQRLK